MIVHAPPVVVEMSKLPGAVILTSNGIVNVIVPLDGASCFCGMKYEWVVSFSNGVLRSSIKHGVASTLIPDEMRPDYEKSMREQDIVTALSLIGGIMGNVDNPVEYEVCPVPGIMGWVSA